MKCGFIVTGYSYCTLQIDSTNIDNKAILFVYVQYVYQEDFHENMSCELQNYSNCWIIKLIRKNTMGILCWHMWTTKYWIWTNLFEIIYIRYNVILKYYFFFKNWEVLWADFTKLCKNKPKHFKPFKFSTIQCDVVFNLAFVCMNILL